MSFRIPTEGRGELGAWLLKPVREGDEQGLDAENVRIEAHETIVIYFHGNAGTRSQRHRRNLYKVNLYDLGISRAEKGESFTNSTIFGK